MKRRIFLFILVFAFYPLILSRGSVVNAREQDQIIIPTFPRCENPQGTIKVSYSSGNHGIPGDVRTHTGSDAVYHLSGATLAQCFCAINGDGIQTNWWKASSLSVEQIEELVSQGWVFIPDGSLWGLEEEPYLAHNRAYDCEEDKKEENGKDEDEDDDDDDEDEDDDDDDQILGFVPGQILGLARTGNIGTIYLLLAIGLSSIALLTAVIIKTRE